MPSDPSGASPPVLSVEEPAPAADVGTNHDGAVPDGDAPGQATTEHEDAGSAPGPPTRLWAVVMVFQISVDLPAPHAVVTLREISEPHRLVALPVGVPEATALAHAWRGVATPRPLTHELFAEVLVRLGATIEVVRLLGRRDGVVLAEMELSSAQGREVVSCRPTDALTLAIRQGVPAPILLDERLFEPEGDVG